MLLRQGMVLAASGIAVGLAASLSLARVLSGFLFGVAPRDPTIFTTVTLLLAGGGVHRGVAARAASHATGSGDGAAPGVTLVHNETAREDHLLALRSWRSPRFFLSSRNSVNWSCAG